MTIRLQYTVISLRPMNIMDSLAAVVFMSLLLSCIGQRNREQFEKSVLKARRLPNLDICGIVGSRFYDQKIVGGRRVYSGELPWIALIGYVRHEVEEPSWQCGGTLITDQYVISAAHCLHPAILSDWTPTTVRLGEIDLNPAVIDGARPEDVDIEKIIYHEQFNDTIKINDIGLVKLKTKVKFTDYINPICLSPPEFQNNDYVGYDANVAGWGTTKPNESRTDTSLLFADVEIRDRDSCRNNITSIHLLANSIIDKRVLCASTIGGDSCQGDSGGPLMYFKYLRKRGRITSGNMFLMGVDSYGYGCGREGYPGVYTRVSAYMNWIVDHLDI